MVVIDHPLFDAVRKTLVFFNKNDKIAVVIFYNNFKLLHATISLVRKSGTLNKFMTTAITGCNSLFDLIQQ